MKRFASFLALAFLFCAAPARAGLYASLDAEYAYRTGTYRVSDAFASARPRLSEHELGAGAALGWTIDPSLSVALEGGIGFSASARAAEVANCGIDGLVFGRFGPRLEGRRGIFFARTSVGAMWAEPSLACLDAERGPSLANVGTARGPYATVGFGARMKPLGGFVRLEAARLTDSASTFTPLAIAIGADVTWW